MPNRKRMREPVIPELDAETFLLWESKQHERHELHHGFVVAFAGGTLDNDRIAHHLRTAFDALFPAPCRSHGSDVKVQIDASTVYSPDATVVCVEMAGNATVIDRPRVVADVLSPSTRAYDIIEKRAMYRNVASLVAYVIVHTTSQHIEIDTRAGDGRWSTQTSDGEPIALGEGALTFEAVYARTSVPSGIS